MTAIRFGRLLACQWTLTGCYNSYLGHFPRSLVPWRETRSTTSHLRNACQSSHIRFSNGSDADSEICRVASLVTSRGACGCMVRNLPHRIWKHQAGTGRPLSFQGSVVRPLPAFSASFYSANGMSSWTARADLCAPIPHLPVILSEIGMFQQLPSIGGKE